MSTPRDQAASGSSDSDEEGSLLIAESIRVPDLPGLVKKTVVLGTDEIGFLTSKGNVISNLGSGTHKVG